MVGEGRDRGVFHGRVGGLQKEDGSRSDTLQKVEILCGLPRVLRRVTTHHLEVEGDTLENGRKHPGQWDPRHPKKWRGRCPRTVEGETPKEVEGGSLLRGSRTYGTHNSWTNKI